uniref:Inositol oxygenase n=1 Tax=Odontella aurita TaxID=265563 RepID=A0A7S4N1T4_9STRA|mmetsp:Transcript_44352/g.135161  ORF Transcript_44352/g.135161 Transcript_44352/m.135161 type:complete len:808 (+) Transcript_44352:289-2712(+)
MDYNGTKRPASVAFGISRAETAATGASASATSRRGSDAKKPRPAAFAASDSAPASLPPRVIPSERWAVLTEKIGREGGETKKLGLRDLFYPSAQRVQEPEGQGQQLRHDAQRRFPIQQQRGGGHQQEPPNDFFTFRLEHRSGGIMARHIGEERIILFRSDRPGAVAKIIYSSTGAPAGKPPSVSGGALLTEDVKSCGEYRDDELKQMAQAKIHVLDVKEPYRGRDLGGLLFSEAVLSLRDHYGCVREDEEDEESPADKEQSARARAVPPLSTSVRCQLDAEEDVRRHNKLVGFYEALGCSIKPKAKIQYLNNNDGETYRKVPMQMALQSSAACQKKQNQKQPAAAVNGVQKMPRLRRHVTRVAKSLVGQGGGFLPVQLLESTGRKIGASLPRRTDWILADDGDGGLSIRTTQGHRIVTTHDGRVVTLSSEDGSNIECFSSDDGMCASQCSCLGCSSDEWGTFRLCRIPDNAAVVSDSEASDAESLAPDDESRRKELWMLRSSHGTFLTSDPVTRSLSCSSVPSFWQAYNADLSLRCTTDTPPRRIHYRHTWKTQCVGYVRRMRDRYLTFSLGKVDVRSALEMAKTLPCHPYRVNGQAGPSLRTFLFSLADAVRLDGYPDWMQMAALVHELGRVVSILDPKTAMEVEATGYDWALSCRSRVVGCAPVRRASFREFHSLNPDRNDGRYNTALGMYEEHCGLENVLLTWTGPEYINHMLRHNGASIPDEGFDMIRLFPLGDWHDHGEYEHLTNEDDGDARPFVSDFYWMRRKVQRECDGEDLSDEECQQLWDGYFSNILEKYHCDGQLSW